MFFLFASLHEERVWQVPSRWIRELWLFLKLWQVLHTFVFWQELCISYTSLQRFYPQLEPDSETFASNGKTSIDKQGGCKALLTP